MLDWFIDRSVGGWMGRFPHSVQSPQYTIIRFRENKFTAAPMSWQCYCFASPFTDRGMCRVFSSAGFSPVAGLKGTACPRHWLNLGGLMRFTCGCVLYAPMFSSLPGPEILLPLRAVEPDNGNVCFTSLLFSARPWKCVWGGERQPCT